MKGITRPLGICANLYLPPQIQPKVRSAARCQVPLALADWEVLAAPAGGLLAGQPGGVALTSEVRAAFPARGARFLASANSPGLSLAGPGLASVHCLAWAYCLTAVRSPCPALACSLGSSLAWHCMEMTSSSRASSQASCPASCQASCQASLASSSLACSYLNYRQRSVQLPHAHV